MPIFNFAPGPSMLAPEVKQEIASMVLEWQEGLSLAEFPHRSRQFESLLLQTRSAIRRLLEIDEQYEVLFLMGGARQQFDWVARNFLQHQASYWVTGHWSDMAAQVAELFGEVEIVRSDKFPSQYDRGDYLFACLNETIDGIEIKQLPKTSVPWVLDASSNIFSRRIEMDGVGLLMAGAQKNAGIAGVTIVVIRKDFLAKAQVSPKDKFYSYKAHAEAESMLVTPPTLAIGALKAVLDWIERQGGVEALERINARKAELLYQCIDQSTGFYRSRVQPPVRSQMNVVFDLPSEALLNDFLLGAQARGLLNLKGHRSVGGVRASIYNAMPLEGVQALVNWMQVFQDQQRIK